MNPLWLLVIVPSAFVLGFFLSAILKTGGRADLENEISFWRNQYFALKNAGRKDVI
jgi:hypothetical protein